MTCNCKSELEAKLTERFSANQPLASGHKVELQNYGITIMENTMVLRPYMPYKAGADYPVKKTGMTKWRTTVGNMMFSYCPFCGVKYEATK